MCSLCYNEQLRSEVHLMVTTRETDSKGVGLELSSLLEYFFFLIKEGRMAHDSNVRRFLFGVRLDITPAFKVSVFCFVLFYFFFLTNDHKFGIKVNEY